MLLSHRTPRADRPGTAPTAQNPREHQATNQVWPAAIAVTAVIVLVVFWVQATFALALTMALATLVAGGLLLTLVSGTAWITQLRHLLAELRR